MTSDFKFIQVWVWLFDHAMYKAVYHEYGSTLAVYDEQDEIIVRYIGLTSQQIEEMRSLFQAMGAKRLDHQKVPFTYL